MTEHSTKTVPVETAVNNSSLRISQGQHSRLVNAVTVERGPVAATRRSSAEAKRIWADRVGDLLDNWTEPKIIPYGGYTGICYIHPAEDTVTWTYRIVCPDGRTGGWQNGYGSLDTAEMGCRLHLSQYVTDYLDDTSVIAAAFFLLPSQRNDHLRYAAWQRARDAADIVDDIKDKHRWASDHHYDYLHPLEEMLFAAEIENRPLPEPNRKITDG